MRTLFFVTIMFSGIVVLLSSAVYADEGMRRALGDNPMPERSRISDLAVHEESLQHSKAVMMRHAQFYLDRTFVPQVKGADGHVLIQFARPVNEKLKDTLSGYGVELLEYIPENTWKAKVPASSLLAVKALESVHAMGNIYPVDKFPLHILEKGLAPGSRNPDGTVTVRVSFHRDVPFGIAMKILQELSASTGEGTFLSGHRLLVTLLPSNVPRLSEYDEVNWIEDRPPPKRADNINAAALSNVDIVHASPYNLDGTGIRIGEWDGGAVQSDHPDLSGRVVIVTPEPVDDHATHVAGTMIGSGAGSTDATGMAPAATLYSYDFYGDVPTEISSAASTYGIHLSNNSWGFALGWVNNLYGDGYWVWTGYQSLFGYYTSDSRTWDQTVVDTGLIIVKGAGNDRNDYFSGAHRHYSYPSDPVIYYESHPADGGSTGYDCIGPQGMAKNIITVGAVDDSGGMSYFSSWGPADDGRVKPDIVTNGVGLVSTCPTDAYCIKSGTSMSTPVATGAVALINQNYEDVFGSYATPDVMKAILINTAEDLGNTGPDYSFGWGLLDAKAAVDLIDAGSDYVRTGSVEHDGVRVYTMDVQDAAAFLKATVAWTDPAGSPGAARALVNNIDMELTDDSGNTYKPWVLNPNKPSEAAKTGGNTVDNVEQISVDTPKEGRWVLRVMGKAVQASQAYALVGNIAFDERHSFVGTFRNGVWYLDENDDGTWNGADTTVAFGRSGDVPVTGDWDGNGVSDVGFFRSRWWYLDFDGEQGWNSGSDVAIRFGFKGDVPVTGDWDGDGTDNIGVFRRGRWYLDSDGIQGWDPDSDTVLKFGLPSDIPVSGDWNGDGTSDVGVFRDGWWYLDSDGEPGWNEGSDMVLKFGLVSDIPVAGDWDGDGISEVGVFRNGWWYLDSDGIDGWNPASDVSFKFGLSTDIPVSGR